MAKEYQSEKSPIFDSQKSKKTRRKLLKMSHLKAHKVYQMFCNTRYNEFIIVKLFTSLLTHMGQPSLPVSWILFVSSWPKLTLS